MFDIDNDMFELLYVDETLFIASTPVNVPSYDLDFRAYFPSRLITKLAEPVTTIARVGAIQDYAERAADSESRRVSSSE